MKLICKGMTAVCLFALPASAFGQSNTTCSTVGGITNCRTVPMGRIDPSIPQRAVPAPLDLGAIYAARQRQDAARQQQIQREYQQVQKETEAYYARRTAEVRGEVSALLREGKCEEAIDHALRWDEIAIASEAQAFCKASE